MCWTVNFKPPSLHRWPCSTRTVSVMLNNCDISVDWCEWLHAMTQYNVPWDIFSLLRESTSPITTLCIRSGPNKVQSRCVLLSTVYSKQSCMHSFLQVVRRPLKIHNFSGREHGKQGWLSSLAPRLSNQIAKNLAIQCHVGIITGVE